MVMSVVDFEVTQRVLTVALGSEKKNSVFKDREAFGFYGTTKNHGNTNLECS